MTVMQSAVLLHLRIWLRLGRCMTWLLRGPTFPNVLFVTYSNTSACVRYALRYLSHNSDRRRVPSAPIPECGYRRRYPPRVRARPRVPLLVVWLRQTGARTCGGPRAQEVEVSADCLDILTRLLVADPGARMSMAEIKVHRWFQRGLPPGALEMNDFLLQALTDMEEVRAACFWLRAF